MTALYHKLNVPPDATTDQIKSAHKKLAKQMHPDQGGDHEEFLALQRAYEVLSDAERRARYDATGDTGEQKPIRERAIQQLCVMVAQLVEQCDPKRTDLVATLAKCVRQGQDAGQSSLRQCESQAKKLEDAAGRFGSTGPVNPLRDTLVARADVKRKEAALAKEGIALGDEMLAVLTEFSYRAEHQPQQTRPNYDPNAWVTMEQIFPTQ